MFINKGRFFNQILRSLSFYFSVFHFFKTIKLAMFLFFCDFFQTLFLKQSIKHAEVIFWHPL